MAQKTFTAIATGAIGPRVDAGCGTTNTSPVVTDTAITANDQGKPVTGTGVPAGTTIIGVTPGVSFTMSANATATGSVSLTIAAVADAGAGKVYRNLSMKAFGSPDCITALETSPDNVTFTEQDRVTGPNWAYTSMHHSRRYARVNVINLGTGAKPAGAVLTYTS